MKFVKNKFYKKIAFCLKKKEQKIYLFKSKY